jgi:hypothetical protein
MALTHSLRAAMRKGQTERGVAHWLKQNPLIISHSVGGEGFAKMVAAEFRFGADYRADFVALGRFSGGFSIHLIELEPPDAQLFTRSGKPAKRLNEAISQVDSWRTFIDRHRDSVLHELSKHIRHHELIWSSNDCEPTNNCGWPLYHPRACLQWYYHVVIGRRRRQSEEELERKAFFLKHHGIHVMTYDRLVDAAKKLDAVKH